MGYKFLREYSTCDLGEERSLFDAQVETERLGHKIYELRKAKGLTKKEVAKLAGVSKAQVTKVEGDICKVNISTILRVLNVLGA